MNEILCASYLNSKFYKDFTSFDYWETEFQDKWEEKEPNFTAGLEEWLSARGYQTLIPDERSDDFTLRSVEENVTPAEDPKQPEKSPETIAQPPAIQQPQDSTIQN